MHLAGLGIDREPFGQHPTECHVRGTDRVGAQHDLVERITGGYAHLDPLERAALGVDDDARAGDRSDVRNRNHVVEEHCAGAFRWKVGGAVKPGGVERAFLEHAHLREHRSACGA